MVRRGKGTISIFTFKDGILATAAHDLALLLRPFDVTLDGDVLTAALPLAALSVIGPVEDGVIEADRFDAAKRAGVEQAMHSEILRTARSPIARFAGRATAYGTGFAVMGHLSLAERTAPLSFDVQWDGGAYRARFELQPSRWGIAPYRALLGAIKLKDVVRIDLALDERRD